MIQQNRRPVRRRMSSLRRVPMVALACVGALAGVSATASATPTVMVSSPGAFHGADPVLERTFSGTKFAGASIARDIVNYDDGFSWAVTDKFVSDTTGHGLSPYLTLTYQPANYGGTRTVTTADFSSFCATAAARYPNVNAFGVMNEPNSYSYKFSDGTHVTHAVDYGDLYRACYSAIKAQNAGAKVYIGELANGGSADNLCNYIKNAVTAGMTRTDGVAIHPYQFDTNPSTALGGGACRGIGRVGEWPTNLATMANLKTPSGGVPPVAITEFGYCASPNAAPCATGSTGTGPDDATRASWLTTALSKANTAGASIFGYYSIGSGAGTSFDTGIMGNDGSLSSSISSLRSFTGTSWGLPGATTSADGGVGGHAVLLKGVADSHGLAGTTYRFEYGTDANSLEGGQSTGRQAIPQDGSDISPLNVSARVDNLNANTQYYYRLVVEGPGGIQVGAPVGVRTLQSPLFMTVTSNNVGSFHTWPWSAQDWHALVNWPKDMQMATTGGGTTYASVKSDPDGDGNGLQAFQTTPFSATWASIANTVGATALATPVGGGATIASVDSSTGILYFQNSSFTASGWQAIGAADDRVALTAPAGGGVQVVARDSRAPHTAYFMNSPFSASGWLPIANSVDEIALTSPSAGGTVVAITDENTHQAYFQNSPYSATGWHVLTDGGVRHISMTRAGNGQARVGIIKTDGAAYIETYPFSADGWQRISPAGWNVTKLAMSGDSLAIIHDESGSPVASITGEPFPTASTFPASAWSDVANPATDVGFDQRGF